MWSIYLNYFSPFHIYPFSSLPGILYVFNSLFLALLPSKNVEWYWLPVACLVSDLGGKMIQSFTIKYDVICGFFLNSCSLSG